MAKKQKIEPVEVPQHPHQAIVSIQAVVNQQLPDGSWHPRSTFSDQFFLRLVGSNEKEVVQNLKAQLQELKELWASQGGQIGNLTRSTRDSEIEIGKDSSKILKGPSWMTPDTTLLNAQRVDENSATSGSTDQLSNSEAQSSPNADTAETNPSK